MYNVINANMLNTNDILFISYPTFITFVMSLIYFRAYKDTIDDFLSIYIMMCIITIMFITNIITLLSNFYLIKTKDSEIVEIEMTEA